MDGGLLLIDNFDSFTFTIADYLLSEGQQVKVLSRQEVKPYDLEAATGIVLSPGPGNPHFLPDLVRLIQNIPGHKPVLGICLGFQALGVVAGAQLTSGYPAHGKISRVIRRKPNSWLCLNLPDGFEIVRYHSLYFKECPSGWDPVLWTEDGILMAIEKNDTPWAGVQFHPEAYLSEYGRIFFQNWLQKAGLSVA